MMFDFDNLKSIKTKVSGRDEQRGDKAEEIYQQALSLISEFSETLDKDKIALALDKINQVIKLKRNNPEPYITLAYVFYGTGDVKLAFQYLKTAESFNGDPEKIQKLKDIISLGNPNI